MIAPSGGFFPAGEFRRQRRVWIAVPAKANGFLRREKMHALFGNLRIQLPQRRDVIQYPERPSVRRNNQVVTMNCQIAHGRVRKVELQRLPVIAVIERNVNRALWPANSNPFRSGSSRTTLLAPPSAVPLVISVHVFPKSRVR